MLAVGLYVGWMSFYNAKHHSLAPASTVEQALDEIGNPDTVTVTQRARVFDRGSTIYAQKYFVSKETPQEITSRYIGEFQSKGGTGSAVSEARTTLQGSAKTSFLGHFISTVPRMTGPPSL
ncbi:hypothetical protein DYST_03758 [Dyella terrae]|nr:hypothetical protein DYST_03758 [Dyella terrae]